MTGDQKSIVELLCGRAIKDKRGLSRQSYLKEDGAKEKEARRALARRLRTARPLDLGMRHLLADLLDPDCDAAERQIRFGHRRRGRRRVRWQKCKLLNLLGRGSRPATKKKRPVQAAVEKFRLVRSRIFEIRRSWKPILERRQRTRPLKRADWQ